MDKKNNVVHYKRTSDEKEFKKQVKQFEQDVSEGKTVCLTDILINAETQHIKKLEGDNESN